MKIIASFFMILAGGEIAPIGYVLGIAFSVIGSILLFTAQETNFLVAGVILFLFGATILFFRIRKDIVEVRNDFKSEIKR